MEGINNPDAEEVKVNKYSDMFVLDKKKLATVEV
jgi:hypothetical protein